MTKVNIVVWAFGFFLWLPDLFRAESAWKLVAMLMCAISLTFLVDAIMDLWQGKKEKKK